MTVRVPSMVDLNALSLDALYGEFHATGLVRRVLELARDEDLGPDGLAGDATSAACGIVEVEHLTADVVAREECVVAGAAAVPELIDVFGSGIRWERRRADGERVEAGTAIGTIEGPASRVVAVERTMLNLLSRLSGIATHASAMKRTMDAGAPGHRAVLLDTRKTTPGLRVLEKYAVRCGGCACHRIGLYDAVLVKDNHLAHVPLDELATFVGALAERARTRGAVRFVEIEVDSIAQFERLMQVPAGAIDIVLADNMTPAQLREAVAIRDRAGSAVLIEASGGVTSATIGAIAATGVDRISAGSLTHGARVVDLGLDAREK